MADVYLKIAAAGATVTGAVETTWAAFSSAAQGELVIVDNTMQAVAALA